MLINCHMFHSLRFKVMNKNRTLLYFPSQREIAYKAKYFHKYEKYQTIKHYGLVPKSFLTLVTPWNITCQAPLSMGFSRQEYWSRLPFPSPVALPDPGNKLRFPTLQEESLPTELQGKPIKHHKVI